MSNILKRLVLGSMVAAGLLAVAFIIDMVFGVPFSHRIVMDALLLVGAGLVLYLAYDAYQDMA